MGMSVIWSFTCLQCHEIDISRTNICRENARITYSDGGRQQPASIGVSLADLNCLRDCKKTNQTSQTDTKVIQRTKETEDGKQFQEVGI